MLLKKILKGNNLNIGPHNYSTIKNILDREALNVLIINTDKMAKILWLNNN